MSPFSNLSVTSPTSQLILQPFRCFAYTTAHSPTLLSLFLRHRLFTYVTWRAVHGYDQDVEASLNNNNKKILILVSHKDGNKFLDHPVHCILFLSWHVKATPYSCSAGSFPTSWKHPFLFLNLWRVLILEYMAAIYTSYSGMKNYPFPSICSPR